MKFRVIFIVAIALALNTFAWAGLWENRAAFKQGYQLFEDGKYYPAIEKFKLAIADASYPLLDYGYFYIAQAYHKSHNLNEALEVYGIVINHFQRSVLLPRALLAKADLQAELNQPAAESTLYRLLAEFPNDESAPEARLLLGKVLEQQNKLADAARVYRNLDLLHPKSSSAEQALERLDELAKRTELAVYEAPAATIYNLGVKYFQDGNYPKARGYFNRLLKFYKRSTFYDEAVTMLGRIYLRKDQLALAARQFQQAININQDSKPEAMYYLALTYIYLDSPQAALNTLGKIPESFPNSPWAAEALIYTGEYYKKNKQLDLALAAFEKLAALPQSEDQQAQGIWHLGNLHYKNGRYQAAFDVLSKANPKKAADKVLFWTAKSAEKNNDREKAIAYYKTTIALHDHSYYGYRAREELKKFGFDLKPAAIPDVTDLVEKLATTTYEMADHEKKYQELLALELGDEAAGEAAFIEGRSPPPQKAKASLAKYHAYVMKGKFAKPIYEADQQIYHANLDGTLAQVDPRVWRFSYPRGYWNYVEKYAQQYELDPFLVYAVIREESRFKSQALSRSAAHGLMQIIPSTGRKISRDLGLSYSRWNMYTPRVNIQMGCYYLATLIKRFNGNISLALAGYNGGPVRVSKWLKSYPQFDLDEFVEDIPLTETRNYVKKVMKSYYGYKRTYSGG